MRTPADTQQVTHNCNRCVDPFFNKNTINCLVALLVVSIATIGCSDSTDEQPDPPLVDLSNTDDQQIRQSAAENALENLSRSLSNAARLSDDPIPVLDSSTIDPIVGDNTTGMSSNEEDIDELNSESDQLVISAMGLDENSQAVITQDGNQITIDPADTDICRGELGDNPDSTPGAQEDYNNCLTLAADLLIRIDAQTEEIGVITFQFRGVTLLTIDYAPTAGSYEVNLSGLNTYYSAAAALSEEIDNPFATLSGAVRFSSSFDADNPEAGNLTIDVPSAVNIADTEGNALNMAIGTLLSVTTLAGSGNGILEINAGAINLSASDSETQTDSAFNMAGLTARVELTRDGQDLKMSNLGLARGPLTVTVNSVEQIRMTLETLGFTISESDGELLLDSDLNLALFLRTESGSSSSDDIGPPETVTTETQVDVSAVAGTGLLGQIASTKVTRGGPFSISINEIEGSTQTSTSVSVEAGQCFGDDEDDTNGEIDILPCDPMQ